MLELIGVLLVIVCILLAITVMVQNPKGGGLSSTFGGGNQVLGVQKTTNFLEKTTWAMAIALLVLVMGTHVVGNPQGNGDTLQIDSQVIQDAATPSAEQGLDINDAIETKTEAPAATTPVTTEGTESTKTEEAK